MSTVQEGYFLGCLKIKSKEKGTEFTIVRFLLPVESANEYGFNVVQFFQDSFAFENYRKFKPNSRCQIAFSPSIRDGKMEMNLIDFKLVNG